MKSLGASDQEINEIRKSDKKAQGITDEDENLAILSVKEKKQKFGKLIYIEALTNKFSAITDLLFPFEKLLIYKDDHFVFYGNDAKKLVSFLSKSDFA